MDHELVSRYISSRIWMVEDQSAKAYLSEYLLKYSIASLGNNNINNQLQVNSVNTFEKVDSQGKITQEGSILKIFFNGSIFIFVDKDSKATVPYGQDGYTFTSGDAGKKTFSKGLSFTKEGKMLVNIGDLVNTSLNGTYIIDVTPGS